MPHADIGALNTAAVNISTTSPDAETTVSLPPQRHLDLLCFNRMATITKAKLIRIRELRIHLEQKIASN